MITIIESYVNFGGKIIDSDLKVISKIVLEIIEVETLDCFSEIDLEFEIHIEEGSLKLRSYVKTAAKMVILYGGLRGAVQFAHDDAQAISEYISEKIKVIEIFRNYPVTYSRSDAGDLNRIRKLLEQADTGLITQQDAIQKASNILKLTSVNDSENSEVLEMISTDFKDTNEVLSQVPQGNNIEVSSIEKLESPKKEEKTPKIPKEILRKRSIKLTKDSATGDVTIDER